MMKDLKHVPETAVTTIFLLLLTCSGFAGAENSSGVMHAISSPAQCSQMNYGLRPGGAGETTDASMFSPNPAGPTLVDIGLFIIDITKINEYDNTFKVRGFLDLVWCDPRLAFEPAADERHQALFLEHRAAEKLEEIWWPDPDFVNQTEPRKIENEALIVQNDGTTDYEEKFVVILKSPFDLTKFPFDRQILKIEIESFAWTQEALQFHEHGDKIGFSDRFEIPEWNLHSVTGDVEVTQEVRDRDAFSEFVLAIEVARKPGYYIWKIMLPLVVLVCASWVIFWLKGHSADTRLGLAFRGVLIVVAYQFLIGGKLPRVSYLTFMDSFLVFSFLLMVLSILQNGIVSHWQHQQQEHRADRLDRISRWSFPLIFFLGLTVLVIAYDL